MQLGFAGLGVMGAGLKAARYESVEGGRTL